MATISKRAVFALAALTIGSFSLAACSSGTSGDGGDSADTGSDSAPAESESYTVLSTDELGAVLEGAGLTLLPQDQVEQAAGAATAGYDSVEPAECAALFEQTSLLTDGATVAMGTQEDSMVLAGTFSYPDSSTIDTMFEAYSPEAIAACPEYTATLDGQTATGTVETVDVTIPGADSVIAINESASVSGMDVSTARVIASKGGVLVNATAMSGDADAATALVTELVAALP